MEKEFIRETNFDDFAKRAAFDGRTTRKRPSDFDEKQGETESITGVLFHLEFRVDRIVIFLGTTSIGG